VDIIKTDLIEIELCDVDWIGLTQDRYKWRALMNAVMELRAGKLSNATQLVAC
jgi:hypothetical protein